MRSRESVGVYTFVLVEFRVEVVQPGNDEVIDVADLITQFLHLDRQLLGLLNIHHRPAHTRTRRPHTDRQTDHTHSQHTRATVNI